MFNTMAVECAKKSGEMDGIFDNDSGIYSLRYQHIFRSHDEKMAYISGYNSRNNPEIYAEVD